MKALTGQPGIIWIRSHLCYQSASRAGYSARPSNTGPKFDLCSCICGHICNYDMCHIYYLSRKDSSLDLMSDHDGTTSALCCVNAAST
jgi:hypothetical protein